MGNVIAIRVSKELKENIDNLDIDYAKDIREYLENRVKQRLHYTQDQFKIDNIGFKTRFEIERNKIL